MNDRAGVVDPDRDDLDVLALYFSHPVASRDVARLIASAPVVGDAHLAAAGQ